MIERILPILFAALASPMAKPNIIYINADDLGVMDVEFNNPKYKTPNIDRLRAEGMLFAEAYAPAANCAPSRAGVMSGQYGPRLGVDTIDSSAHDAVRFGTATGQVEVSRVFRGWSFGAL